MTEMNTGPTDAKLSHYVHLSLKIGLWVSAVILYLGLFQTFRTGQHASPAEAPDWRSLTVDGIHGDPAALLNIGLLVLMATPVVRVVVLGAGWLMDGERMFAAIAIALLALLILSAILGSA